MNTSDLTKTGESDVIQTALQPDPRPDLVRLLADTRRILPAHLRHDRFMVAALLIFRATLPAKILPYFNFVMPGIDVPKFRRNVTSLSGDESILVDLAFHLYSDRYPLPAGSLDGLVDRFNLDLARLAIHLAHGDGDGLAPWESPRSAA